MKLKTYNVLITLFIGVMQLVFAVVLLSVSLSMDSLFLGLAYGIKQTKIPLLSQLMICLFSILYAIVAIVIGSSISTFLPKEVAKIAGGAILAVVGIMMLINAFKQNKVVSSDITLENTPKTIFKLFIKSLGLTIEVLKNPQAGDIDHSGTIDLKEAFLLGLALSLDSLGTGIGSALSGLTGWYIPVAIGFFQLIFLNTGLFFGKFFPSNQDNKIIKMIPGTLLLALFVIRVLS